MQNVLINQLSHEKATVAANSPQTVPRVLEHPGANLKAFSSETSAPVVNQKIQRKPKFIRQLISQDETMVRAYP